MSDNSYDWAVVRSHVSIVDNQHPVNTFPLFRSWMDDGWQVMSVMTLPPTSNGDMCIAVGTIRKPKAIKSKGEL